MKQNPDEKKLGKGEQSAVKKTLSIPNSISDVRQQMDAKKNQPVNKKNEGEEVAAPAANIAAPSPVNRDSVQSALEEVLEVFKEDHKSMEMAVLKQPFEIKESQINFLLHGGLQEDIFVKLKPELTALFRRKLQKPDLEITFEIREEAVDPSKHLYTSSEKLSFLLKKSPALKELKNRFGLETDF